MKTNIPPAVIAAGIAGGSIGFAGGFMTRGEKLENYGASDIEQLKGGVTGGLTYGIGGAGISVGVASTTMAIRKILGK